MRLSAAGELRECLAHQGRVSLRDALRQGLDEAAIIAMIRNALDHKATGHRFEVPADESEHPLAMSAIGG